MIRSFHRVVPLAVLALVGLLSSPSAAAPGTVGPLAQGHIGVAGIMRTPAGGVVTQTGEDSGRRGIRRVQSLFEPVRHEHQEEKS